MATGDIGSVLNTLQFEAGATAHPSLALGLGNLVVIAARGPDLDGFIYTCLIDSLGNIPAAIEDSWEFDTTSCDYPRVVHVFGNIFACIYYAPAHKIEVFTFSVSPLGVITKSKIDTAFIRKPDDSADVQGYPYSFFRKSSSYFAYAYQTYAVGKPGLGILGINNIGTITSGTIPTLTLTRNGGEPHQTLVSSGIGVVVYRDSDNDIVIETHSFTSLIDLYEIDDSHVSYRPKIAKVHSNVYAVALRTTGDPGLIKTCFITTAGAITKNIESSVEYYATGTYHVDLYNIGDGAVVVLFRDNVGHGRIRTFPVSDTAIFGSLIGSLEFDTTSCSWPIIALRSNNVCVIVYQGSGEVITVDMDSTILARVHHELLMGVGP